ncbi:serine/threonine protein kinase [Frankia sp. R82]|uniref:serine/threonine protein kinase n=1 Tax=Frankia sp. R82 TaxID=2950553 RepID=UPI002043D327|nr:protein kinase [Frankia sp. R82]MCM3887385.1 protein kinase [Frankia sp. R82]
MTATGGAREGQGAVRRLGSRYVLHEVLGQGTTGQVWRGARVSDGTPVAIKVLRRELADDPVIVERFLREWDLLATLDDPGLVAVRDLVNEPDTLALVMDLVEGPDLRAHLREFGPRPAREAVGITIGTLDALDRVHAAGIVHRDVKPENILIDTADPDRPVVRLTDFGIARMVGPHSRQTTGPVGTPLYMAPELGAGAPPTAAADVYAAGVVLYEILAGSPPFDSPNPVELLRAHREDEPELIQGVPAPLWDVLSRMLAKSPRQRPMSAAEAADELDEALAAVLRGGMASAGPAGLPIGPAAARPGRYATVAVAAHPHRGAVRTGTQRVLHPVGVGGAAALDSAALHTSALNTTGLDTSALNTTALGTSTILASAASGSGASGGAGESRANWNDMEHTQIAGSLPPATGRTGRGWESDAERTRIAGATGAGSTGGFGGGGGNRTGARAGWDDADAPTGLRPAVRVPARSGGPAADTNTVMSAVAPDQQPAPSSGGPGGPGGPRADRRRRTRIAAGAGLVVALVAGAGGWALASNGDANSSLSAATGTEVSLNPSVSTTGDPTSQAPGVIAIPGATHAGVVGQPGAHPVSTGANPANHAATTAPAAAATAASAATTAGSPPSPSPTDDGTAVVPNTEGTSVNAAVNTLAAAGFQGVDKKFDCYDTGAVDAVVRQSPKGVRVAKTTRISLQVQGNDCTVVPNVTGMTEAGAKNALSAKGFYWVNGACPQGYTSQVTAYTPTGRRPSGSTTITLTLNCTAPAPPPTTKPTAAKPTAAK